MAEICLAITHFCGDGGCQQSEERRANMICRDDTCQRCEPGDELRHTCRDGQQVPWCRCDAGGVLCVPDPEAACAAD